MAKKKTTKKTRPVRTKKKSEPAKPKKQLEEPKPDFEESLKEFHEDHSHPPAEPDDKPETRGGARPGAGRPRGTDNLAEVNRLPEKANETLIPVLQIPFKTWATAVGVKELELNKDEAKDLALPVTQLLEFYFPGRIPEIAWVWLMMLGSTYRILEPRMELLAQKRQEQGPSVAAEKGPVPSGRPRTGAAEPAGGYPQE